MKPKRILTNFNFENDGAAVALVGKHQGGPANAVETIVFKSKSTVDITDEQVEKASMVTVTLSITEYLRKFFGLWYDDAELLARVMGYNTDEEEVDWDDYLDKKVEAVSIMKSLVLDKDEVDTAKAISELNPKDYLTVLKSQEVFESNYEIVSKETVSKKSSTKFEGVTASKGAISPSVEKKEEDSMSEFITKAAMQTAIEEAVQKALAPVNLELEKAKEQVKQYEVEKAEVIAKSRRAKIDSVISDKDEQEELFKAMEGASDVTFEAVIKSLNNKKEIVKKSELLDEIGSTGTEVINDTKADRTLEILKSQIKNK